MEKHPSKPLASPSAEAKGFQINESESGIEASESSANDLDIVNDGDDDDDDSTYKTPGLIQQAVRSAIRTAAAASASTMQGSTAESGSNQQMTGYSGDFLGNRMDSRLEPSVAKVIADLPSDERALAARGAVHAAEFARNDHTGGKLRVSTSLPHNEETKNEVPTPSSGYDGAE
ncbi:hypothetical protein DFQ28_000282 [Apophysomyces sp. BC1034]|nr:hypothetical protein DFQ29_005129 [Apophysomyces sp. BC1021]KAG0191396.1 hypothetical protein DFQ28_000282 [Apophysomyces sp. BC1034]